MFTVELLAMLVSNMSEKKEFCFNLFASIETFYICLLTFIIIIIPGKAPNPAGKRFTKI